MISPILLLALGLAIPPVSTVSPALPRMVQLGAKLAPAETGGVAIDAVAPGSTADRLGLQAADVLLALNNRAVDTPQALAEAVRQVRVDEAVQARIRRDGRELTLRARAVGRPRESFAGASVRHGAVPFNGGLLRDIWVTPAAPKGPVLFMLQGYPCTSFEAAPGSPDHTLIEALLAAGIAVYRVEKPGVGDSRGGQPCREMDFATELAAFRAAYDRLTGPGGVAPERLFLLGHSMGGLQAPLIAAAAGDRRPRGIAVYGAALRPWHDYMMDAARVQSFLLQGADPVAEAETAARLRPTLHALFIEKRPLAQLAADPAHRANLAAAFSWQGGEELIGRHHRFWQGLADLKLTEAWRDAHAYTLAMFGEADFVALEVEDHKQIAAIVDHYHPGAAAYVEFPQTDHLMLGIGDLAAWRARNRAAGGMSAEGSLNPAVARTLIGWIGDTMQRPRLAPVQAAAR